MRCLDTDIVLRALGFSGGWMVQAVYEAWVWDERGFQMAGRARTSE